MAAGVVVEERLLSRAGLSAVKPAEVTETWLEANNRRALVAVVDNVPGLEVEAVVVARY